MITIELELYPRQLDAFKEMCAASGTNVQNKLRTMINKELQLFDDKQRYEKNLEEQRRRRRGEKGWVEVGRQFLIM